MTREADACLKLCCVYGRNACAASLCMAWRWQHEPPRQRITCPDSYATVEEGMTRPARAAGWEFAPWDGSDYPAQWLEMLKLLLMNAYMSGINAEMRRALDIPIDAPILPGGAA